MRSNLLKHNNLMLRSERRERLEAWAASESGIAHSQTYFAQYLDVKSSTLNRFLAKRRRDVFSQWVLADREQSLLTMLRSNFRKAELATVIAHEHSTLGASKGVERSPVHEMIFYAH
jgi:hypothetical protein